MTLNIISPSQVVFEGEVTSVTLPGEAGRFTVLRDHAALISTLAAGVITYTDAQGAQQENAIKGGIVSVNDNVISVCIA